MRVQNKLWMSRNEVVLHVCTFVEHGLAGLGWGKFILVPVYFCLFIRFEVEGFLCAVTILYSVE